MLENFYLVAGMQAVAMKPWLLGDVDVSMWDGWEFVAALNGIDL